MLSDPLPLTGADPLAAILSRPDDAVLAVIAGTEGPSYRAVGAMMAVFSADERVGTLSSGCIEADISLHAMDVLAQGTPRVLRYGRGSPFRDIELPCGGGLDVLLLPRPNRAVLQQVTARQADRVPCAISLDMTRGAMSCHDEGATGRSKDVLWVRFDPPLQFLVFGKGPEASTFASLVHGAGYPNQLLSPDTETTQAGANRGIETRTLVSPSLPDDLKIDARTAIVLFFHDHEWEPPILTRALDSPAFYIGAQGSQRARDARMAALSALGVPETSSKRLHGPVGLIPSARDPGTLAVSVLAEVLAKAMAPA